MMKLCGAVILVALMALPASAQPAQPDRPPCAGGGGPPGCLPPMPHPDAPSPKSDQLAQPDWYIQKKCPATVDCMPSWEKGRAERCKWVKANCPDTKIAY